MAITHMKLWEYCGMPSFIFEQTESNGLPGNSIKTFQRELLKNAGMGVFCMLAGAVSLYACYVSPQPDRAAWTVSVLVALVGVWKFWRAAKMVTGWQVGLSAFPSVSSEGPAIVQANLRFELGSSSGQTLKSTKAIRTRKQTLDPASMQKVIEMLKKGDKAGALELIREKMGIDPALAAETVDMIEKLCRNEAGASSTF